MGRNHDFLAPVKPPALPHQARPLVSCQARTLGPSSRHDLTPSAQVGTVDEQEPIVPFRHWVSGARPEGQDAREQNNRRAGQIAFDRKELNIILGIYGTRVAAGDWRDYALDFGGDTATFSIFRRSSEVPLYRIVKDPSLARKQGIYSVIAQGGLILKRGQDLAQVLGVLMKRPKLISV